jgi:hypothetical protein
VRPELPQDRSASQKSRADAPLRLFPSAAAEASIFSAVLCYTNRGGASGQSLPSCKNLSRKAPGNIEHFADAIMS